MMSLRALAALCATLAAAGCTNTTERSSRDALPGDLVLSNVSVLLPLPSLDEADVMLGVDSAGAHGPLLPHAVFDALLPLSPAVQSEAELERVRVVAARLDPCAPSLTLGPSADCRHELRLVMQPLIDAGEHLRAEDAAIHAVYALPASALLSLLLRWRDAAGDTALPDAPLGPHPLAVAEGAAGPFALAVGSAILEHAGAARLARVTFMRHTGPASWTFGGVELHAGALTPLTIPSTGATEQRLTRAPGADPLALDATIEPALPPAGDNVALVLDSQAATALSPGESWLAYERLLRIENPDAHSPMSVDCASCHAAPQARRWLESRFPFATAPSASRFASSFDLATLDAPFSLRAFGWHDTSPVVSARTANDSAAVAAYLNALGRR